MSTPDLSFAPLSLYRSIVSATFIYLLIFVYFQEIAHLEAIQQTSDCNMIEYRTKNKSIMFYSSQPYCVLLYRTTITIPCNPTNSPKVLKVYESIMIKHYKINSDDASCF